MIDRLSYSNSPGVSLLKKGLYIQFSVLLKPILRSIDALGPPNVNNAGAVGELKYQAQRYEEDLAWLRAHMTPEEIDAANKKLETIPPR
jgi:hypothetical protein